MTGTRGKLCCYLLDEMKAFYTFDSGSQRDVRCEQMIGVFDFSIRSQSIVSAYYTIGALNRIRLRDPPSPSTTAGQSFIAIPRFSASIRKLEGCYQNLRGWGITNPIVKWQSPTVKLSRVGNLTLYLFNFDVAMNHEVR
jgi:hypothetical protein